MQHNEPNTSGISDKSCLADTDVGSGFKAHSVLNVDYINKANIKKWYVCSIHSGPYI